MAPFDRLAGSLAPTSETPASLPPAEERRDEPSLPRARRSRRAPGLVRPPDSHSALELFAGYAEEGTASAGSSMPHFEAVQRSFGPDHDLSGVTSHLDRDAAEANDQLGARAFTYGEHVAFGSLPDLHTVAHELTHVLQQRSGLQQGGGIGGGDDAHERHADAVAARVVAGRSAADLLPAPGPGRGTRPVVQRRMKDRIDVEEFQQRGAHAALAPAQVEQAIRANDARWKGDHRRFLRGGPVREGDSFNSSDVAELVKLQAGAETSPSGVIDDSTMAMLLHAGLTFPRQPGKNLNPGDVTIEFWPGELEDMAAWDQAVATATQLSSIDHQPPMQHLQGRTPEGVGKLYVKVNGRLVAAYRARGGPPVPMADIGGHQGVPTKGSYQVGRKEQSPTTDSWATSTIPWGAHVRRQGDHYEFLSAGARRWKRVPAETTIDPEIWKRLGAVDGHPDRRWWNRNDFGPMRFPLEGGSENGLFVHTTPRDEAHVARGKEVTLQHSHGCVHVDPRERDDMIARGFLQPGVRFECKDYRQRLMPEAAARAAMAPEEVG